jgi:hypothetical protein
MAIRLTFVKQGDQLRLHSKIAVDTIVPPDGPAAQPSDRGFWLELRDSADRTVFRRVLHNPLPQDIEVFSPDVNQTVARVPMAPAESVFSVLVPDTPAAESVTLFSSEHRGHPIEATSMLATYTLQPVGRFANRPAAMIARFALKG